MAKVKDLKKRFFIKIPSRFPNRGGYLITDIVFFFIMFISLCVSRQCDKLSIIINKKRLTILNVCKEFSSLIQLRTNISHKFGWSITPLRKTWLVRLSTSCSDPDPLLFYFPSRQKNRIIYTFFILWLRKNDNQFFPPPLFCCFWIRAEKKSGPGITVRIRNTGIMRTKQC